MNPFDRNYRSQIDWQARPAQYDTEAKKLKGGQLNELPRGRGTIPGFGYSDPAKSAQIKKPSQI
jgi:hypothetical protein